MSVHGQLACLKLQCRPLENVKCTVFEVYILKCCIPEVSWIRYMSRCSILHMSFKAYCRGMQGIYANEVWWLLWSPRISSVNSLYGMMHTLVMMSPSVQCACVKQLGWGFFLLCIFKFFFSSIVTQKKTQITW